MKLKTSKDAPSFLAGHASLIARLFFTIALAALLSSCQSGYRDSAGYWHDKVPVGGGSNWATDQCAWQKSVSYGSRTDVNHQVPRIIYYQIPPATVAAVRPMSRSSSRSSPIAKNKKSSPSKAKGVEKQISYAVVLKSGIPPTGSRYEYSVRKFASLKGKEECTFLVSHVGVPGQVEQWMLSPVDFYPFWARQIHQGGKIVTLDPP